MNPSQVVRAIQKHSKTVKIREHGDLAFSLSKGHSCFVEFQQDQIKVSCTKAALDNVKQITGLSFEEKPNGSGTMWVTFL